jgi:hypothetical protein
MKTLANFPLLVLVVFFFMLWLAANLGSFVAQRQNPLKELHHEFGVVQGAMLTLLGLLIGFSFSMAVSRYDQRKNLEEEEANAIGTEYVRVDLLSAPEASRAHGLLKDYLDKRILFYQTRDEHELQQIDAATAQLQAEMWSAVRVPAAASPNPVAALTVAGMNDVLNSQGYTQAAWWNRIPSPAWGLMIMVALISNLLIGYGVKRTGHYLLLVLPIAVAISFFLIADMDSARRGTIRVRPQNLISLSQSLQAQ